MSDNPYENISDEELDDLIFQGAGGFVGQKRKELLSERQWRRDKKDQRIQQHYDENKRDQKQIKRMTLAILILTLVSTIFIIFQIFHKSPISEKHPQSIKTTTEDIYKLKPKK